MSPHRSGKGSFLERATEIILANIENEHFGVSDLSRALDMSRSNLHRKIHSLTGKSVSQFLRELRLNKALELLKDSDLTVSEVAYRVGFGSPNYFSKCFHDRFGYPPGEAGCEHTDSIPSGGIPPQSPASGRNRIRRMVPWFLAGAGITAALTILFLYLKPFSRTDPDMDRTIMVLPFRNDNPNETEDYIINGLMEELINKLSLINELDVISRTTSENYRNSTFTVPEIGREAGVKYILEGSVQSIHQQTRIRLQLIEAESDRHLWSKPYERGLSLDSLFDIQEKVALLVASELEVVLNFQEERQLGTATTENLKAYNAYLKGMDLVKNNLDANNAALNQAEQMLKLAISLDPGFSEAYTWLGHLFISKRYYTVLWSDPEKAFAYNDTGHHYLEQAIQHNPKNWFARALDADYYQRIGNYRKAHRLMKTVIRTRRLDHAIYEGATNFYLNLDLYARGIRYYSKYIELKPIELPFPEYFQNSLLKLFMQAGVTEMVHRIVEQQLQQNHDTLAYYMELSQYEHFMARYDDALKLAFKGYALDSLNPEVSRWIRLVNCYKGDPETAIRYQQKAEALAKSMGEDYPPHELDGYLYLMIGDSSRAEYLLNSCLENNMNQLQRNTQKYQDLAIQGLLSMIYAIRGNRDSTLKYVQCLGEEPDCRIGRINYLKNYPPLEFVRDTPEYEQVLKCNERVYRRTHRRITRLLRKHGLISS